VSLFKRGGVWWSYFYEDGIRHQQSTGASIQARIIKGTLDSTKRSEVRTDQLRL
jgi:hypothetical protein